MGHRSDLDQLRLGATLAAALPGAAAVVTAECGWSITFAPPSDPRAQLPLCHLRAAIAGALATGDRSALGDRFGAPEGPLGVEVDLTPGGAVVDVGAGVHRVNASNGRHYVLVTLLPPALAKSAIVQARTAPACPASGAPLVAEHLKVQPDPATLVTLVALADTGHPTASVLVEDLAVAMAAACLTEELTDEVWLSRQ